MAANEITLLAVKGEEVRVAGFEIGERLPDSLGTSPIDPRQLLEGIDATKSPGLAKACLAAITWGGLLCIEGDRDVTDDSPLDWWVPAETEEEFNADPEWFELQVTTAQKIVSMDDE